MRIIQRILEIINDLFTFKPYKAITVDLAGYGQKEQLLQTKQGTVSIRYKITDSPHFILFSHGNGSNVDSIKHIYDFYHELGVSYLAYDYPGYGKSTGYPSELGCYKNFDIAYNFIIQDLGIDSAQIILHGLSLGGAVTLGALKNKQCSKIILEATFTSGSDMAKHKLPFVPNIKNIFKQFDSLSKIVNIKFPLLLIHGRNDEVIPYTHSEVLYLAANGRKKLYLIENCGHFGIRAAGGDEYLQAWKEFLDLA